MEKATKLTIVLQPTNVEAFKNRSIADAGVLELAAKVVEAGQEHGFGTASAPTRGTARRRAARSSRTSSRRRT